MIFRERERERERELFFQIGYDIGGEFPEKMVGECIYFLFLKVHVCPLICLITKKTGWGDKHF